MPNVGFFKWMCRVFGPCEPLIESNVGDEGNVAHDTNPGSKVVLNLPFTPQGQSRNDGTPCLDHCPHCFRLKAVSVGSQALVSLPVGRGNGPQPFGQLQEFGSRHSYLDSRPTGAGFLHGNRSRSRYRGQTEWHVLLNPVGMQPFQDGPIISRRLKTTSVGVPVRSGNEYHFAKRINRLREPRIVAG